jgi:hypothetical protein
MVRATMRAVLLAALAACAPTGAGTTSSSTSSTSDPAPTTAELPTSSGTTDGCEGSGDCETEGICVADYTPSADPENPGMRGPSACREKTACIAALDLGRFCFDHQGCCETLRCRTVDGVCEPADLGMTGAETTGTATDTSTSADTTTATETDSDSDSTDTTDTDTTK